MPLVSEAEEARRIYQEAGQRGLAVGCFCTENQRTTEAILQATYELGQELDRPDLPVVVGFTAGYAGRSNARHYTSLNDNLLGAQALVDDLRLLLSSRSPCRHLRVMLHLDHGHPQRDAEVIQKHLDVLASVMYDASEFPLAENMERTARFVTEHGRQVLIEGAVDEIYESGSGVAKNELTDPQTAVRYLTQTGVDLLVPNVGTEHRATVAQAQYHGERARAIAREVGARLCLHGTSSLSLADVRHLPGDGFIKVNVWTVLPRTGAQAVARSVV
jgi:fructose-bisphosphate aldolase class II